MKKLFNSFFENFDKIYILSLFIISFGVVLYLFPGEGKFRYEFQKGQPWMHEDLVAPFDFAVNKMDNEIKAEKKEISNNFSPYFNFDSEINNKQLKIFKSDFDIAFENYKLLKRTKETGLNIKQLNQDSLNFYFKTTQNLINEIYKKGVLYYDEDYLIDNKNPVTINIVKKKIAINSDFDDVYSLKSAYSFLINELNKFNFNNKENKYIDFIKNLNLNKYIQPNLFYDKISSGKILTEQINNISLTRGMVQQGERIIYKGEVVDEDKYRTLESLRSIYLRSQKLSANRSILIVGQIILVFFSFFILYLFLNRYRIEVLRSRKRTLFILFMILLAIFMSKIVHDINIISIYIIPFAILPIILNTFYDSRLALYVHFTTILIAAFFAPNSFEFVLLQFMSGVVATLGLKKLQKRSQFVSSSILAVLTYFLVYFGIAINQEGNIQSIVWINFAWFSANGVLLLLSYPLVYVFEKTFKFLSDVTLMEISDTNQPLLRELAEKAPGTFQHSMQVANLAEEAIRHISGNTLLVRAGALYHDIGKMSNPQYFTENQISGINPHDKLTYTQSAEIIINHVIAGTEMAKKANLPSQIIDFIQTHHGTTKTQYFYRLYKKENPDAKECEHLFTYPGRKPFSKETAVLMMADTIEAASRSLKDFSKEKLDDLIENLIEFQMNEKQFDIADITLFEISEVKKIFKEKLQNIYHARIEYPKEEK
ncbi:MAG: HDIG domain-containing protein [Bacteroidales bacterium]|nr:HDIG domain-containing protein [Bacteroidales bacterium]